MWNYESAYVDINLYVCVSSVYIYLCVCVELVVCVYLRINFSLFCICCAQTKVQDKDGSVWDVMGILPSLTTAIMSSSRKGVMCDVCVCVVSVC